MPRTETAEFTIEYVEVLSGDGRLDDGLAPDLSDDELLELYELMKRSRRLDERAIALQRRGELGTYAPAIGQEAAQVGSAFALEPGDWFVPSFREQGAAITRGTPEHGILWYAMGMEEGAEIPEDANALPPAVPVGTQALHAAGIGWGNRIRDDPSVAIGYFGDGATSEGDVYEALNFAGVFDARTVFFCQNNQYAISTPRHRQTDAETLAQKAISAGIEGIQVDGNDVLGVYAVTSEALERARNGTPVLVEALTYRRSMHTTSDDPRAYRETEEETEWVALDPIVRFQTHLRERGVLDDATIDEIDEQIEDELAAAIDRARDGRRAVDPSDMFRFAFAELPPTLERQRESFEGDRDAE